MQQLRIVAGILVAVALVACGPTGGESLSNMLEHGRCKVTIAIWEKVDQGAAEGYRDANNKPTTSCPKPDVTVKVITDPEVQDGTIVDKDHVVLRYKNKATAPPAPSTTKSAA